MARVRLVNGAESVQSVPWTGCEGGRGRRSRGRLQQRLTGWSKIEKNVSYPEISLSRKSIWSTEKGNCEGTQEKVW